MRANGEASRQSPHLIAMAGLPGSGKSSIAEALSRRLQISIVSIDPIEAAMWRSGLSPEDTGIAAYRVAQTLAAENLKQGLSIIVDAVNPIEAARQMWRDTAQVTKANLTFIETICSDEATHKSRIEARKRAIEGMAEVTWARVQDRAAEYQAWTVQPMRIDTAPLSIDKAVQIALNLLTQTG